MGVAVIESGFLCSQILRNRKQGMPCRAILGSVRVSQMAEGVKGKHGQEPLWWFLQEGMDETGGRLRVGLF